MTAIEKQHSNDIKAYLEKATSSLRVVANKYMDPERLIRIALVARAKTPLLMKCSNESILMSLMQAAEMGLEPNTPLQHAALVPRRNKKTGQYECQFMPMYRGLIELGRRADVIDSARAVPIYSCDDFKLEEGLAHTIEHRPKIGHDDFGDPGKVVLVYAVAQLTAGGTEWTYMTKAQINRIKTRSAAGGDGPWVTDWEEMAKKTVLRRLFKLLPLTIDVAKAIEHEDEREPLDFSIVADAAAATAEAEGGADVIDIATGGELAPGQTEDVGAKLAADVKKQKDKVKPPPSGGGSNTPPQGDLLR